MSAAGGTSRNRYGLAAALTALAMLMAHAAAAQQLRVPDHVVANAGATLTTSGDGSATFYLVGPGTALKREVKLGEAIELSGADLRNAGRYSAILKAGGNAQAASLLVAPAQPAAINFMARPSRVPVAAHDAISGVAFVFDDYKNLVTSPAQVTFNLAVGDAAPITRKVEAREGIAWTRLDSARKAGAAQFVASIGDTNVRRVVQQVASDPCGLRFHTAPAKNGVTVETDPVKDCSGNPVPDGTIVTFVETDGRTRSTVDARIKRGIAQAELPAVPGALITVASGVATGNEVRLGGGK
ncbi:MAG TPA: hypothetical protein VE998_12625 [Terriglobales bacterium]|nr:hypothetical protein [Terriglobales bacterium]